MRAAGSIRSTAGLDHTYLKTMLFMFAFTSRGDENESKGNSRRGTEPNCRAPTLTCSRRQRARAEGAESEVKSQTFLRETKGRERLMTLPPAHATNTRAGAPSSVPQGKAQRPGGGPGENQGPMHGTDNHRRHLLAPHSGQPSRLGCEHLESRVSGHTSNGLPGTVLNHPSCYFMSEEPSVLTPLLEKLKRRETQIRPRG